MKFQASRLTGQLCTLKCLNTIWCCNAQGFPRVQSLTGNWLCPAALNRHCPHSPTSPLDVPSALPKSPKAPVGKKGTFQQHWGTRATGHILQCCRTVPAAPWTLQVLLQHPHSRAAKAELGLWANTLKLLLNPGKIAQNVQSWDILITFFRHNKFSFLSLPIRTAGKQSMLPDKRQSPEPVRLVSPGQWQWEKWAVLTGHSRRVLVWALARVCRGLAQPHLPAARLSTSDKTAGLRRRRGQSRGQGQNEHVCLRSEITSSALQHYWLLVQRSSWHSSFQKRANCKDHNKDIQHVQINHSNTPRWGCGKDRATLLPSSLEEVPEVRLCPWMHPLIYRDPAGCCRSASCPLILFPAYSCLVEVNPFQGASLADGRMGMLIT